MNRYRRDFTRLQGYDYSQTGEYFITICTHDRECLFGEIRDGKMELNSFGIIVQTCWNDLPNHYANVELDEYAVMPNHFHGVVEITNVGNGLKPFPTNGKRHGLPEIMRGFKTFSSRHINEKLTYGNRFQWQKSYYDRIIRNESALNRVRQYILDNPLKWEADPENPVVAIQNGGIMATFHSGGVR